ncbi:MAG: hypothetical protein KC422_00180 [Trueperaceae bacterium]|nr:hypothetical protein [Trueperaceae bacterium]
MKQVLLLVFSLLAATVLAQPQGQFQGPSPEMRAKMEPYFNLVTTVSLVLELEKNSDLPLSSEQASALLPLLSELSTSPGYSSERASELLDTIELDILTPEQLIWIDGEFLKRQETGPEARGGFFGGPPPGGQNGTPPQQANGNAPANGGPGGRGGPGGFFQKIMAGEPVNMFSDNPNAQALLNELIELERAKLN